MKKELVRQDDRENVVKGLLILGGIWLIGALGDRLWLSLDRSVPAWDQADYLNGAMNYWKALQTPQWFSGEWWRQLWLLSTKIPPFTYISTVPFINLFGTGVDSATLVQLFYSAILLFSVYGLGVQLFSINIGLWSAGLCQLLPGLYQLRLEYLLDFPLTAVVTLSFFFLTAWKVAKSREWLWAIAFGLSLGLALMVKQTALFFLLIPGIWVGVETLRRRQWERVAQLIVSLFVSLLIFGSWYRTNWLFILTSGKRATIDSAIAEGDPALNTLGAWTFYGQTFPSLISWVLLLIPIVGILIYLGKLLFTESRQTPLQISSIQWLATFWIGGYFISSLNINKDARYILPLLPVTALILAYGLMAWGQNRRGNCIRWGTVSLAVLLMILNLFPVGGKVGNFITILSPNAQHFPYWGMEFPHSLVIDEIIKTEPYLQATVGVLPSTPEINQHNFTYYGSLRNFQVYGRQVGTRKRNVELDARSLDWFLTKTGNQGLIPESQPKIVQIIESSADFQLQKSWTLPDSSTLNLYHRRLPSVQVEPGGSDWHATAFGDRQVHLNRLTLPSQTPPGVPIPVTYEWSGSGEQLQSGLVLLTWRNQNLTESWIHDRGIGMGHLTLAADGQFNVIERTAMLPQAIAGTYTLEATYLNRKTGETYAIAVPPTTLKIDTNATPTPSPELDWVTQLRTVAADLPKGRKSLDRIFDQTGRINQYDPHQDYLKQAQQSLEYRLQQEPNNREWAYALALSQVLQRQVTGSLQALKRVVSLDFQNPYAHAYLAFVYLYDWQPSSAQNALKPALVLDPNSLELKALDGITALMQGNLVKVWRTWQELEPFLSKKK